MVVLLVALALTARPIPILVAEVAGLVGTMTKMVRLWAGTPSSAVAAVALGAEETRPDLLLVVVALAAALT
jgi:hypothetical protein